MRQRAFFVGAHQPAITGDIRRQNGYQSPLYAVTHAREPARQHSTPATRCLARRNVRNESWVKSAHGERSDSAKRTFEKLAVWAKCQQRSSYCRVNSTSCPQALWAEAYHSDHLERIPLSPHHPQ